MVNQTFYDSVYETFKHTANKFPMKPALIYKENMITYKELDDFINKVSVFLSSKGITRQEKVIIYLSHVPQWFIVWMAVQRIGAIAVPVTHFYGAGELQHFSNSTEAETIFCMDTNYDNVDKILDKTSLKKIIITTENDLFPREQVASVNLSEKNIFHSNKEFFSFPDILKTNQEFQLPEVKVKGSDIIEILFTGGTTGVSKGVPIPNIAFLETTRNTRAVIEPIIPRTKGVVFQGAPLYHILGQDLGIGALLSGDSLVLLPKLNIEDMFYHIEKYKVTTSVSTPTMCRMILEHEKIDNYDLSSLRFSFCGGEVLPADTARRWFEKFGVPLYPSYGSTETCGGITLTCGGEPYPEGTAGKVVPTKKIKIINPNTLENAAPFEQGELLVSSENMVKFYWNNPDETGKQFVEIDGTRWYRTGDIVRVHEDGWLFFIDRSADIIKHKGYRVSASKIEAVLYDHYDVNECCVVGVPDKEVGEKIKAYIVLKENVQGLSPDDFKKCVQSRLSSYEIPHFIEFREMLPKSKVGKILRRELREEERLKQKES